MRELTLSRQQIAHPEVVDGKTLWIDPEVKDIMDRLQNGDPTLGWEGDARLGLYREKDRWVLLRLEVDGQYRTVCRSRPGLQLDATLIMHLVAHDLRRKSAEVQLAELDAANTRTERDRDQPLEESAAEKLRKVYWALNKDVGHHY